ncbi:MAG: electron transport complex subunit RsxA [Pseudomonadota bacterium]
MSEALLLIIGAALVNNVVLAHFLGLCPFMGVSNRLSASVGLGAATALVLSIACALAWLAHHYLLVPLDAHGLRTLVFILVIAVAVQATELLMRRFAPLLFRVLGIYVPLITTNCAVLGVALMTTQRELDFLSAVLVGLGTALGFTLVLVLFAALRERVSDEALPALMRGAPVAFLSAGMMSLAFMGLRGLGGL